MLVLPSLKLASLKQFQPWESQTRAPANEPLILTVIPSLP